MTASCQIATTRKRRRQSHPESPQAINGTPSWFDGFADPAAAE